MQIKALSVSEVNQYMKRILGSDPILSHIYVKGEISNYRLHSSGHMYFTLKDKNSKISCVMFKGNCEKLKFFPEEGMSLVCKGYVSIYEKDGQVQLYVNDMEPSGIGALHLAFQQLKDRLNKEGLFDTKYKQEIPLIPRRIALITSPTGAAIRDMVSIILRRFPQVELCIFPVLVQGEGAVETIVKAIELCNRYPGIDLAIVGRGGGSIEELWAFNEEKVARAIFNSRVPIISAVGHETDFTISDFVADLRAATPSSAAELAVPNRVELREYIDSMEKRMIHLMKTKLNTSYQKLSFIENSYFFRYPLNPIYDKQQYINDLLQKIKSAINVKKQFNHRHLKYLGERLHSLSPLSIFSRGYSIVRNSEGSIVKSTDHVQVDERLCIDVIDGEINCKVIECKKEEKILGKY
ncbi:exodeoxyribonuclease VII large subunit [Alkaliphilus oremlandii]|uniref:Exodeoxyribonuclease 7 large subunit n=1 Tax=Alkaliphilus oremlandii (strain OhILAs) TaxID=350688 RepID=EX7L_ALKOO|nr:exodeoxyribonuclease VII large subunit [Alkaliphilus oremlandii]A8MFJ1.1 RecName: Full=Exodeoxyribonuclease 7 large subunit; AltName: Full=Exodeoxyribonuclease VII large subunit; Short=Exonuclease VII large subunit [Alkaliphilus oremlandii OhILAs]ABW19154.1 exodeoxyribonuclease VII, large subunit [Alkaliphilus oremlandii OhILAs]